MGGADLHGTAGRAEAGHDGPGPRPHPIDIAQAGAAQSSPGRQKRDRFEQVGFAGAVRSGQDHRPRINLKPQVRIAAEINQRETADSDTRRLIRRAMQGERHQTRMGIST